MKERAVRTAGSRKPRGSPSTRSELRSRRWKNPENVEVVDQFQELTAPRTAARTLCVRARACAHARARVDPRAELPCLLFHSRRMTADPKKRGRVPLPSSFRKTFIFALSVIETPRTRNIRARLSRSRVWEKKRLGFRFATSRTLLSFLFFFLFPSPPLFVFPLSSISVTALQGELVIPK